MPSSEPIRRTPAPWRWLALLLLLVPSAWITWQNRDLPHFCLYHDDCVYFVSGKALAEGKGYLIPSLPGSVTQTKYPPVYPFLLSLAWRIDPRFPENLSAAAALSWMAIPLFAVGCFLYAPKLGLEGWRRWLFISLLLLNPYTLWFSSQLLSEPLFIGLALLTLICSEKAAASGSYRWTLFAGAMAGVAYLTRTAGIVLLPSVALYLVSKKRFRQAAIYSVAMLPWVAAWTIWVAKSRLATSDPALIYYTDYLAYQFMNVNLANLPLVLWKNVDGFLTGLGALVLPKTNASQFLRILRWVIAIAMISGSVRMIRQGHARLYALFAAGSSAILLVWHYPPDERFVLPVFPFFIAGLFFEMEFLGSALAKGFKHEDRGQRIATGLISATAGSLIAFCAYSQFLAGYVAFPENLNALRSVQHDHVVASNWVEEHTSPTDAILSNFDPFVYLGSNRSTIRRSLLTRDWYKGDEAKLVSFWGNPVSFARDHKLRYLYWLKKDPTLPVSPEDVEKIEAALETNPSLTQIYTNPTVTIYRLRDESQDIAARQSAR